ncbi:MAG TPA: SAM-dependent methyltransferase [Rikenellaceae bacterium]|nr:SAM-dependent methyltransferase [Rikenellaceae bacterium]
MKGTLYLIPSPLGDNDPAEVIPASVLELIPTLSHFFVEELRTARRYLSKTGLKGHIDSLSLYELNEHTGSAEIEEYIKVLLDGNNAGLISEAGLPAVADPGSNLVALAHKHNIKVVPLSGPSSIVLSLIASGMNGQNFAFNGYLPVKPEERKLKIKQIEKLSLSSGQSQIIIETPYRNNSLFEDIIKICHSTTRLAVAANITLPDAFIKTKTIEEWKKEKLDLNKKPCVFIL